MKDQDLADAPMEVDMPSSKGQKQSPIEVHFVDDGTAMGTRTGNNAAWLCRCGRTTPLLGYSDLADSPQQSSVVECEDCHRQYRVVAPSLKKVPTHVQEILVHRKPMSTRDDLQDWVLEALRALGGSGKVIDVCKYIWRVHEADLRASGDLFYSWQYDVRWAAQRLRDSGKLRDAGGSRSAPWQLA